MRRPVLNVGLLAAALALSLVLAEAGLRLSGFSFEPMLEAVEFGWPNPAVREKLYRSDPDLFWVRPDYRERLDALAERRPHVLFLGDSCTEWGRYPNLFLSRVQRRHPDVVLVSGVLGTAGWSSYQGLQQLTRDVLPLRPRVVTIYFGWNDHWRTFGPEDREIHSLARWSYGFAGGLRLGQLILKTRFAMHERSGTSSLRVSAEDFRENLRAMVRLAREGGVVPVLLTAPTNHEVGAEPEHLATRWVADLEDLIPLHQRYVSIVRDVARSEFALLCDLAARFEQLPRDELRDDYFTDDGIHLTLQGDAKVAEILDGCFEDSAELRGVWSSGTRTDRTPSVAAQHADWVVAY